MVIRIISDTHGRHEEIEPLECDLLIHCGDASNHRVPTLNQAEFLHFWDWWSDYPANFKVFVPGNHDSWLDSPMSKAFQSVVNGSPTRSILINESVTINGIKIWGSPYTPTFGEWSFMKDRSKIGKYWEMIPDDIDILITHGPPKGILDLSEDKLGRLEFCGDKSLLNRVYQIKPQIHAFGHIHSNKSFKNQGVLLRDNILFVNASCLTDGQMESGEVTQGFMFDESFNIL